MSKEVIEKQDYYHVKVPGDGDCFFHSIVGSLHLDKQRKKIADKYYTYKLEDIGYKEWAKRSLNLRKTCVQWMRKNLDTIAKGGAEDIQTAIQDAIDDSEGDNYKDIPEYLKKMIKSGEYGGQPEIYALSEILQRNIITYVHSGKSNYKTYGGGLSCIYDRSNMEDTIYLYHNVKKTNKPGLHHFEILYPKSKARIIKKDVYDRSSGKAGQSISIQKPKPQTTQRRKAPTQRRKAPTQRRKAPTQRRKAPTQRRKENTRRRKTPTQRRKENTRRRKENTRRRSRKRR